MDGLPYTIPLQTTAAPQRTLKASIDCVGVGVHSGRKTTLTLQPAPVGSGIVFRRTDLNIDIPARFDHVDDTRLCTVLALPGRPEARVGTVEHVMAALAGCGVTNAVVTVDGPEVPILDGSAASFVFLIDCAGIVTQDAPAPTIEVLRTVRVTQGHGENAAFAELRPAPFGLDMAMSIAFDAAAIGRQALSLRVSPETFRADLARARTFTLAQEVAALQAAGLALGGSLDNAVVVDNARVLNPGGLRVADEFVRHKMLDAVGDLALAGAALRGRLVAHRSGHALNNQLLRALFADDANWRLVGGESRHPGSADTRMANAPSADGSAGLAGLGSWQERRVPVAAAPV
ncbi:UDP-3-O-acyl-N-acetylglucosamine deacetylase [Limobrevibacterium gyesilva]|uniref:UDP-3-O-acyl-N-acetylglucosamine deacetylase n=1 Tax=Limobrevibacterium gyesilva TaxID=2991712 RepID=A0AA42CFZ5_9PROT|nr:UDP-3-O-acyl-N-acetylglucosamine deacetylase [Limobrevibacterium gyesilva]MCW3477618.1 UDP-3-O-acyl-N-acetylglucosamine deacetylase [Limobrevibacterium gyesilva]